MVKTVVGLGVGKSPKVMVENGEIRVGEKT